MGAERTFDKIAENVARACVLKITYDFTVKAGVFTLIFS